MTRDVYCLARLPLASVFFCGPRWRELFGLQLAAVALGRGAAKVLIFDFEHDVRERVCLELRPDVFAEWSDPREQLGL